MSKNKYFDKVEAAAALERSINNIEKLLSWTEGDLSDPDNAEAVGVSFADHLYDACEAALYIVCDALAVPDGTVPYLSLKDLFKEGHVIGAPADVRCAADSVVHLRKEYHKNGMFPDALGMFAAAASLFLDWICRKLREYDDRAASAIKRLEGIVKTAVFAAPRHLERRVPKYAMQMLVFRNTDIDALSDEKLDRLYRRKKVNSNKSLVPLYIYEILRKHSDKNNPMTQADILKELKYTYEVQIGRQALGRHLNILVDSMMGINRYAEGGYFYDIEMEEDAYGTLL